MAREAADLRAELDEGAPARRGELALGVREQRQLLPHALRVPAVGEPGEPLELGERESERLADVANRAVRAVGGEARDERGMLAAVALGDRDDQLLADVAREVEVDVGDARELVVDEAAKREAGGDGIDVREPGQVADDRADGAAAPASRRQEVPHRAGPAHLERDLPRQLEDLPVQEEEPGQPEPPDQLQLFVEAGLRTLLVAVRAAVALGKRCVAHPAELLERGLVAVREVGIAVPELLGQVEAEAVGERPGALQGVEVAGEALCHRVGAEQDALTIAAPLALAALERCTVADRDEDVLQRGPSGMVCVDVAGRDRLDSERLGEVA